MQKQRIIKRNDEKERQPGISDRRWAWIVPALSTILGLVLGLSFGVMLVQSRWGSIYLKHDRAAIVAKAGYRAHQIFTTEVLHPVEVDAVDQSYLLSWLTDRIGVPFHIPDLSENGLKLLGGRLLPVDGDSAAQLMYENVHGDRYTLLITRIDGGPAIAPHFAEWNTIGSYYWIYSDIAYALNGPRDGVNLAAIAKKTYEETSERLPIIAVH